MKLITGYDTMAVAIFNSAEFDKTREIIQWNNVFASFVMFLRFKCWVILDACVSSRS